MMPRKTIDNLNARWADIKACRQQLNGVSKITGNYALQSPRDVIAFGINRDEMQLVEDIEKALLSSGQPSPWLRRNKDLSVQYVHDHKRFIPLSLMLLESIRSIETGKYQDFSDPDHAFGCISPLCQSMLAQQEASNTQEREESSQQEQALITELAAQITNTINGSKAAVLKMTSTIAEHLHDLLSKERPQSDDPEGMNGFITVKCREWIQWMVQQRPLYIPEVATGTPSAPVLPSGSATADRITQFNLKKNAMQYQKMMHDLTYNDPESSTPDQIAAWQESIDKYPVLLRSANSDMVKRLIDNGLFEWKPVGKISLQHPNKCKTLINRALEIPSYGLLKVALQNTEVDPSELHNALFLASTYLTEDRFDIRSVKQLLRSGADAGKCMRRGLNALMYAINMGNDRVAHQLIASGVDVNIQNNRGTSALMLATIEKQSDIVKQLIAAGADLDACDVNGNTSLIFAASKGSTEIVQLLLAAGAAVDRVDKVGKSALEHANCPEVIELINEVLMTETLENPANRDSRLEKPKRAILTAIENTMLAHTTTTTAVTAISKAAQSSDGQTSHGPQPE